MSQADIGEANRRLAGIMAADVVGYSAMVGTDEPATLARVRTLRTDLVEPVAATHGGRLFKTTGDGFLIAFASAVQALRCAIAIQERLRSDAEGLRLRIGVHQGEVVAEGDDLLGDGVIIAARLEPLAEPGGICISARVREDAAGKMALEVDDLGTPELKNIAAKVQVFRVRLGMPERPALPLHDKPSIAVLAFTNMSADREQEFFADGIAEDIITALSKSRFFFVIARNSSFTYKGKAVAVKDIGRELGVRYVLEGSVRRSGERVRVGTQLVDAETGGHVWAEHYDRDRAEIFALQDEITEAVIRSIEPAIAVAEQQRAARKAPGNLSAWEAYQRGLWYAARPNAQNRALARELFERSIALDPMFAPPHARLASMHILDAASYLVRTAVEAAELAEPLAQRAIELDPHDADAHAIATIVDAWKGEWEGALARAEQAVAMNPSSVLAHRARAFCLYNFRRRADARTELTTCLRLSSRDPQNWLILQQLALTHYLDGEYPTALCHLQRAVRLYPSEPQIVILLAAALGQLGRLAEGQETLRRAEALLPAGGRLGTPLRAPFKYPEDHEHILDGLRKAGWQG